MQDHDKKDQEFMQDNISSEMKASGFTFREPNKNHPKYKLARELCKDMVIIDMSKAEFVGEYEE